ncbi:MAG: HFX_2341 family transcriptional regulator domain-containing protein [Cuniculiplasma sp.]
MKYTISISGFQPDLIINPILRVFSRTDLLVLLVTDNEKSIETSNKVHTMLEFANIKCQNVKINNIFNFFEVLVNLENLYKTKGKPTMVNVSAGPGIAIASMTFFSITHDIPVIFHNKEKNETSRVDIYRSKHFFKNANKNRDLLDILSRSQLTLEEISHKLNVSKSTASRRVKMLRQLSLVEVGSKSKKMLIRLSDTGLKFTEFNVP